MEALLYFADHRFRRIHENEALERYFGKSNCSHHSCSAPNIQPVYRLGMNGLYQFYDLTEEVLIVWERLPDLYIVFT